MTTPSRAESADQRAGSMVAQYSVIPAEAGTQGFRIRGIEALGSRLRGNDDWQLLRVARLAGQGAGAHPRRALLRQVGGRSYRCHTLEQATERT